MAIEQEITKFLLDSGALKVGFTNQEKLKNGPPSTVLSTYLPEAKSAIVFALPLDSVRPEMKDFGRDQGVRKILPQVYGWYSEDKILSITQISGKITIYRWALDRKIARSYLAKDNINARSDHEKKACEIMKKAFTEDRPYHFDFFPSPSSLLKP